MKESYLLCTLSFLGILQAVFEHVRVNILLSLVNRIYQTTQLSYFFAQVQNTNLCRICYSVIS